MQAQPSHAPRRRPSRRAPSADDQFSGTVLRFDSRPRIAVGDVVELCRGCLPGNRGKLAVVTGFDEQGFVTFQSTGQPLDAIDLDTGEVIQGAGYTGRTKPENLHRRSNTLAPKGLRYE